MHMPKKELVYIALGGNIGNRKKNLVMAAKTLSQLKYTEQFLLSSLYQTSPVGGPPQRNFYNAVCRFYTQYDPQELLIQTQKIEQKYHKKTSCINGPRTIDLDILFFGTKRQSTPSLTLPHPRWKERLFVLYPLSELTNEVIIQAPLGKEKTQNIEIKNLIKEVETLSFEKVSLLSQE